MHGSQNQRRYKIFCPHLSVVARRASINQIAVRALRIERSKFRIQSSKFTLWNNFRAMDHTPGSTEILQIPQPHLPPPRNSQSQEAYRYYAPPAQFTQAVASPSTTQVPRKVDQGHTNTRAGILDPAPPRPSLPRSIRTPAANSNAQAQSAFSRQAPVGIADLANAYSSPIEYDGQWYRHITKLPLDLHQGYLPDNEPILESIRHYPTSQMQTDCRGPPKASKWFNIWVNTNRDIQNLQQKIKQNSLMSSDDLQTCCQQYRYELDLQYPLPGNGHSFTLRLKTRQTLYEKLFAPFEFEVFQNKINDYVEDIISSKVSAICRIECFILDALDYFREYYKIGHFPNLEVFVEDFYNILESEKLDGFLKPRKTEDRESEQPPEVIVVKDIQTDIKLDQMTWWLDHTDFTESWKKRWDHLNQSQQHMFSKDVMRNYICGVIDAMFGLWPAPGQCVFHQRSKSSAQERPRDEEQRGHWVWTEQKPPRCIKSGLYFWEKLPTQPDIGSEDRNEENVEHQASVSLETMDAILIETRLPYRFKSTPDLHKHLTIKDPNILVYTNWRRFLMLRYHRVLIADARTDYDDEQLSRFQLFSRSIRTGEQRINGKGGDVRFIAYELIRTYHLLFYREVSENGRVYWHESTVFPWRRFWPWKSCESSKKIASQRLHLELTPGLKELLGLLARDESDEELQSGDFRLFRRRLEALNSRLNAWKPSTFIELILYRGWVEEETDFGQLIIGMIGLLGIPFVVISLVVSIITMYFTIYPSK